MARPTLWIFLFWLSATLAYAEGKPTPPTLRLNQAHAELPNVTVWLNAEDSQGHVLKGVQTEQFAATIGKWTATPQSLKPFTETGAGVTYIFLLDVSKSLNAQQFKQMQTGLVAWLDKLRDVDRVALLSFGSQVKVLQDFSKDKAALKHSVAGLALSDDKTLFYQALKRGLDFGQRGDTNLPKRRVLVVLSDGLDDATPGNETPDEVLQTIREQQIPIYAIAVKSQPLNSKEIQARNNLGVIARTSGGILLQPTANNSLQKAFNQQFQAIQDSLVLTLQCPDCQSDGQIHPLSVHLRDGEKVLPETLGVRLLPKPHQIAQTKFPSQIPPSTQSEEEEFMEQYKYLLGYALGGSGIILLGIIVYLVRRRKLTIEPGIDNPDDYRESLEATSFYENGTGALTEGIQTRGTNTKLQLTVVAGNEKGRSFEVTLAAPIVLGRGQGCSVRLSDDSVSTRHAEIYRGGKGILLKDLGSKNRTSLNGVPIVAEHTLQDGDLIMLGRIELRITL